MQSTADRLKLLPLRMIVKLRQFAWDISAQKKYRTTRGFLKCERILQSFYKKTNPYTIARLFDVENVYGETPLHTMENLLNEAEITRRDHLYILGSGRGRGAFFARTFFRCSVTGIEIVPFFVTVAERTRRRAQMVRIKFKLGDYTKENLSKATIVYYYGTCDNDDEVMKLESNLKSCKPGTKVLSISQPIASKRLEIIKTVKAQFVWGETECYIQRCR